MREPFDYTKWHGMWQEQFEDMSVEELSAMAMEQSKFVNAELV